MYSLLCDVEIGFFLNNFRQKMAKKLIIAPATIRVYVCMF